MGVATPGVAGVVPAAYRPSAESVECRRVPLSPSSLCVASAENRSSALRLLRSDDVVVDLRAGNLFAGFRTIPARIIEEKRVRGARPPTRWNARIYRRREHWPYGCSSETESGAVTSGLLAVSREGRRGRRGGSERERESEELGEGGRLERVKIFPRCSLRRRESARAKERERNSRLIRLDDRRRRLSDAVVDVVVK